MDIRTFLDKSSELFTEIEKYANERGWVTYYDLSTNQESVMCAACYRIENVEYLLGEIGYELDSGVDPWYYYPPNGKGLCKSCKTLDKAIEYMLVEYGSRAIF